MNNKMIKNQESTSVIVGYWHQRANERHGNPLPR